MNFDYLLILRYNINPNKNINRREKELPVLVMKVE
jgi:hypothetical protein